MPCQDDDVASGRVGDTRVHLEFHEKRAKMLDYVGDVLKGALPVYASSVLRFLS